MVKCPGCKTMTGCSTHGRCLLCGYQIFPSKTLEKRARDRKAREVKVKHRPTRKRGEDQEMEDEE